MKSYYYLVLEKFAGQPDQVRLKQEVIYLDHGNQTQIFAFEGKEFLKKQPLNLAPMTEYKERELSKESISLSKDNISIIQPLLQEVPTSGSYFSFDHPKQFTYLKIISEVNLSDAKEHSLLSTPLKDLHIQFVGYTPSRWKANFFHTNKNSIPIPIDGIAKKALAYLSSSRFSSWQHHNNPEEKLFWDNIIPSSFYSYKAYQACGDQVTAQMSRTTMIENLDNKQYDIFRKSIEKGTSLFGDYATAILDARIQARKLDEKEYKPVSFSNEINFSNEISTSDTQKRIKIIEPLLSPLLNYAKDTFLNKKEGYDVDFTRTLLAKILMTIATDSSFNIHSIESLIKRARDDSNLSENCRKVFDQTIDNLTRTQLNQKLTI